MVQVFDYRTVVKQVSNTLKIGKKIKGNGLTATLIILSFGAPHISGCALLKEGMKKRQYAI